MFPTVTVKPGPYGQKVQTAAEPPRQAASSPDDEDTVRQSGAYVENLMSYAENGPFKNLSGDFLKEMEKDLEVGSMLQRAADSMQDSQRGDRISKLKARIAELKERLKFASPQQAKALLRDLKQISKEFKLTAQSLSGDAGGSQLSGANAMAASSQSPVSSQTEPMSILSAEAPPEAQHGGRQEAETETLLEYDMHPAGREVLEASFARFERPAGKEVDPGSGNAMDDSAEENSKKDRADEDAASDAAGQSQNMAAATLALREVIAAYTGTSQTLTKEKEAAGTGYDGTAVRRAQAEELRKISKEIKALAEQIKRLMDKDDRDQKNDMKKALSDLEKGNEALDKFQLQAGAGTISASNVQGDQTAAVFSSPSLEVSAPAPLIA